MDLPAEQPRRRLRPLQHPVDAPAPALPARAVPVTEPHAGGAAQGVAPAAVGAGRLGARRRRQVQRHPLFPGGARRAGGAGRRGRAAEGRVWERRGGGRVEGAGEGGEAGVEEVA